MDEQHRQQIETQGYRELVADHCELVDRVAQLEERLVDRFAKLDERIILLEYLLSEEVMGSLVQPDELRAAVAEMRHSAAVSPYVWCSQCGRKLMRADADVMPNCPRCKRPCGPLAVED